MSPVKRTEEPNLVHTRFFAKVNKTSSCWHWTGTLNKEGYGSFSTRGKTSPAHRFAYQLLVGPVPDGLQVDHLCHGWDDDCAGGSTCLHRRCVNPEHLEPVPAGVNNARGNSPSAAASRRTHCPRGHAYDETNTAITAAGWRRCRECRRFTEAKRSAGKPRTHVPYSIVRLIDEAFPDEPRAEVIERAIRTLIADREGTGDGVGGGSAVAQLKELQGELRRLRAEKESADQASKTWARKLREERERAEKAEATVDRLRRLADGPAS
ncbi:MAG TPA: HNH endonuclease signature motif containing protein [Pseudonocardia sp.]